MFKERIRFFLQRKLFSHHHDEEMGKMEIICDVKDVHQLIETFKGFKVFFKFNKHSLNVFPLN